MWLAGQFTSEAAVVPVLEQPLVCSCFLNNPFIIQKMGGAVTCSCVLLYEDLEGAGTRLLSQCPGEPMCSEVTFDVITGQAQKLGMEYEEEELCLRSGVMARHPASAAQTRWDHLGLAHSHSRVCPSFSCVVEFLQHLARQDLM